MVRNFGERRKKRRGQQQKKPKTKGPRSTKDDEKGAYEGIRQELVTCREVAIYVPKKEEPKEQPKIKRNANHASNNSHCNNRQKKYRHSQNRCSCFDSDEYEDEEYHRSDPLSDILYDMGNMSFMTFEFRPNRLVVREIPVLPALLSLLMSRR